MVEREDSGYHQQQSVSVIFDVESCLHARHDDKYVLGHLLWFEISRLEDEEKSPDLCVFHLVCVYRYGDAHVREYRAEIFEQVKYSVAASTSILIICSALVSFLTACAIKRKRMEVDISLIL